MMGKQRLIIAEKPDVGRTIAEFLGCRNKHKGYIEGNQDIVTWARGHVVELASPEEVDVRYKAWNIEDLPILPDPHPLVPDDDAVETIRELMDRDSVGTIINACDNDREGQGIFKRIMMVTGCKKPVMRLWQDSLTDEALRKAFGSMKPDDDPYYEGLGNASLGRALADWDVGMNVTRCTSLLYRGAREVPVLRGGRVQTPTLNLVVKRQDEIDNFTAKDFFQVRIVLEDGTVALSDRMEDKGKAVEAAARCEGKQATCEKLVVEDKKDRAPTLLSLADAQKTASRLLGMSASETLEILQGLYEAKLTSYPRTDSSYVTTDDLPLVRQLVGSCLGADMIGEQAASVLERTELVVDKVANDKKVGGHGALLPTEELTAARLAKLSEEERAVVLIILYRLAMACMPPREHTSTKAEITCEGLGFNATGDVERKAGWKELDRLLAAELGKKAGGDEDKEKKDSTGTTRVGTGLSEGASLQVTESGLHSGKTTPPKPYTQGTLLEAMEHAGRFVDDADLKAALSGSAVHASGIGTPATRASIIQGLMDHGYITETGKGKTKRLEPTALGRQLVGVLPQKLLSPELTAEWESQLNQVEHGELTLDEFMEGIRAGVRDIIREQRDGFDSARVIRPEQEVVGPCPKCGKRVVRKKSGSFSCESNRWKKNEDTGEWKLVEGCGWSMRSVHGHPISLANAKKLLEGKSVTMSLKSKDGKPYKVKVTADADNQFGTNIEFVNDDKRSGKATGRGSGTRRGGAARGRGTGR